MNGENALNIEATQSQDVPRPIKQSAFLKDVLICSLGAYGGPEAHMGVFIDQMVVKRGYLSEEELVELLALCSILPGPTSTQTIVAIGYKAGGPLLAWFTMLVWAAPILFIMTVLSFLYGWLSVHQISSNFLRFIGPMAVGFIVLAAYRIGRKVVTDKLTAALMIAGVLTTYYIRSPWIFPLVLLIGGSVSIVASRETDIWTRTRINPPWRYFIIFVFIALGSAGFALSMDYKLVTLFESFYRYGYLVFGGGQVVVPVMYSELVELRQYMTDSEFLTGYGLVQGLPGPMFSFAAYAGGMAARGGTAAVQVLGAIAGGIGIFLPGLLLIYFVYPVWERIRTIRAVKISLKGINAVAGGMITAAAVILMQKNGPHSVNILVVLGTVALLATRKIPAPLLVLGAMLAGALLS